jgi:hypothetical protein
VTPRHSRPDGAEQNLEAAVREAKEARDKQIAEAETAFWTRIAELKGSYRGAQTDIANFLGITRDAILKAIKKHTS